MNHAFGSDNKHCALCGADLHDRRVPWNSCPVEMQSEVRWVVHSPYPKGTWRGIEKCSSPDARFDALFHSEEECKQFIAEHDLRFVRPVLVVISCPPVGAPIS